MIILSKSLRAKPLLDKIIQAKPLLDANILSKGLRGQLFLINIMPSLRAKPV
jgi:hypothetical protein